MLQRVLKTFAKWESLPTKNIKDLQDEIRPLLKGQQYLLDEFAIFFADDRVPERYYKNKGCDHRQTNMAKHLV